MSRDIDHTNVSNTCPLINYVIDAIRCADWDRIAYYDEDSIEKKLEEIRQANSDLRTFGNEEAVRASEMEDERDDLEKEKKELLEKIEDLEYQLKNVEDFID